MGLGCRSTNALLDGLTLMAILVSHELLPRCSAPS
jgi:hypothetical protein